MIPPSPHDRALEAVRALSLLPLDLPFAEGVEAIARTLAATLGAPSVALWASDRDGQRVALSFGEQAGGLAACGFEFGDAATVTARVGGAASSECAGPAATENSLRGDSGWRSAALRSDDERVGGLAVANSGLSDGDPPGLSAIAALVASRIIQLRPRPRADAGSSAVELDALRRVANILGRTLDLQEVLDRGLDFAVDFVAADTAALHLFDDDSGSFELAASRHLPSLSPRTISVPQGAVTLDQTGTAPIVLHADDPHLTDEHRADFRVAKTSTAVLVPLNSVDRMMGILSLGFAQRRIVSPSLRRTLMAIGEQQALAIDRARAHQVAAQRAQLQATLREVSEQVIAAAGDVTAPLLDGMMRICRGPMARLAALDDFGRLVQVAGHGFSDEVMNSINHASGRDPLWKRLRHATEPVMIEAIDAVPTDSVARPLFESGQVGSVVMLPLRVGDRLRGVLTSASPERRRFNSEEMAAMRLLSSLAAAALESQRLRRAAEAEHRHLTQLIDRLPVPIAVYGAQLEARQINAAYRQLVDAGPGAMPNWQETIARLEVRDAAGSPVPNEQLSLARALGGAELEPIERQIKTSLGTRTVTVMAVPLSDEDGRVNAAVVALSDVTALRELADAKDRFLAVASHELRSPLASLHACVSLLQIDPLAATDAARREQLMQRIHGQIDRLSRLVDDLIDTARLRDGSLPIDREPMDLVALAHEAVELAELQTPGLALRLDAPAPVLGRWDRHRLAQVATNLISNAVRYSPGREEVVVEVRLDGDDALLVVRDRGIGIAPPQLATLFAAFARGREAYELAPRGLGLGLFISREIVRRHGGEITVESELGHGSAFSVRLPLDGPERSR